ncbi:MAG TPA: hypothetical protein VLJ10_02815 [Candidatus Bathyarchaeia archaeon]|nr:hypothetical protein [Candidatus Bathyarchaeia archaeon]
MMKDMFRMKILLCGMIVIFGIFVERGFAKSQDIVQITLPEETVELSPPLAIKNAIYDKEDEGIGIEITDSSGRVFSFCLAMDADKKFLRFGLDLLTFVYVNTTDPNEKKGEKMPYAGMEEKSILKMLKDLMDERYSIEEQRDILRSSNMEDKRYLVLKLIGILEGRGEASVLLPRNE